MTETTQHTSIWESRSILASKLVFIPQMHLQGVLERNGGRPGTAQGGDIGFLGVYKGLASEASGRLSPI